MITHLWDPSETMHDVGSAAMCNCFLVCASPNSSQKSHAHASDNDGDRCRICKYSVGVDADSTSRIRSITSISITIRRLRCAFAFTGRFTTSTSMMPKNHPSSSSPTTDPHPSHRHDSPPTSDYRHDARPTIVVDYRHEARPTNDDVDHDLQPTTYR